MLVQLLPSTAKARYPYRHSWVGWSNATKISCSRKFRKHNNKCCLTFLSYIAGLTGAMWIIIKFLAQENNNSKQGILPGSSGLQLISNHCCCCLTIIQEHHGNVLCVLIMSTLMFAWHDT